MLYKINSKTQTEYIFTTYEDESQATSDTYLIHEGELGSAFIALSSINLLELMERIKSVYWSYEKKSHDNIEITYQDWLAEFEDFRSTLGDANWTLFLNTEMLAEIYQHGPNLSQKIITASINDDYPIEFNEEYVLKRINEYLMIAFSDLQAMQAYWQMCILDESFYSVDKYKFVESYYVSTEDSKIEHCRVNTIDLENHQIPWQIGNFLNEENILNFNDYYKDIEEKYVEEKLGREDCDIVYRCSYLGELMRVSMLEIISAGYRFKVCENCSRPFIPRKRADTIYCERPAPQDTLKTCKQYGARLSYSQNLKNSEAMSLYRKIYMAKQMLAKRNPDISEYQESFELYKKLSKEWKANVKAGMKTESEYIEWLKSVKEKKVL